MYLIQVSDKILPIFRRDFAHNSTFIILWLKIYALSDSFSCSELLVVEAAATPPISSPHACSDFKPLDILDELLKKPAEAIRPIWEVQLQLVFDRPQHGHHNSAPKVIFKPSADDFQASLQKLLNQYETVVSDFVPISDDARITSFLEHSKHDLLMILSDPQAPKRQPASWPDVDTLLLEYGPYVQSVTYIEKTVSVTMKGVQKFIAVNCRCSELSSMALSVQNRQSLEWIWDTWAKWP